MIDVDEWRVVVFQHIAQAAGRRREHPEMPTEELERLIQSLEDEMHDAAKDLRFEYAARIRDEVKDLRQELESMRRAGVG